MKTTTTTTKPATMIVCVPGRNDDDLGTYHVIARDRSTRHPLDGLTFPTYEDAQDALTFSR